MELLKNLNVDYLKKNHWMPLKRDRTAIEILTDDPGDLDRVQTSNAPSQASTSDLRSVCDGTSPSS